MYYVVPGGYHTLVPGGYHTLVVKVGYTRGVPLGYISYPIILHIPSQFSHCQQPTGITHGCTLSSGNPCVRCSSRYFSCDASNLNAVFCPRAKGLLNEPGV